MTKIHNLKPCPFCNKKVELFGGVYSQESYSIWCSSCRLTMKGGMNLDRLEGNWNVRFKNTTFTNMN